MTKEEYLDFCGSIAGATYDQLDSDVPTEEIEDLTLRSFELTKSKDKKKTKKRKEAL